MAHESLSPGDICPACGRGKLYALKEPARFLRIVGQAPLVAVCWDCQRLRCSACGLPHTARAPDEAQGDKHSETAAAMMVLLRYDAGVPLNRLEQLQHALKTPVPSSTQWDVANTRVSTVEPVYRELIRSAAQSSIVHNDDTYVRVLEFMGKRRAKLLERGALPSPERTGLFTTAIVAFDEAGRTIALFFTGRQHAGENLTDLLNHRAQELEPPVLMCDALARNLPKGHQVVESNCASHGRRHFVDEAENFPSECRYLLEMLGRVFKVDELCRTYRLSDEQRLRLHQRESGPGDGGAQAVDGGRVRGEADRAQLRHGQRHQLHAKAMEQVHFVLAQARCPTSQQHRGEDFEKGHPAPQQLALLSKSTRRPRRRHLHVADLYHRAAWRQCLPLPHNADAS